MDTVDTDSHVPGHAVAALYQAHAVGMTRIALLMLGDRAAAEDVVQDAFLGVYRRWGRLSGPEKAEAYLRSAVFNGCRDALRRETRRTRRDRAAADAPQDRPSAEALALISEDRRRILAGLQRLPGRQREALVCRYYLELSEAETAAVMNVSAGTVKSTTSRALTALGKLLREGLC